jgi:hypothetical protein
MISILTDFGYEDTYVAAMKAVIYGIAPSEKVLDLTHSIPHGDVLRGALELWRIAPVLPPGTVLLGVVDPGVGTARKAIAFRASNFICVGPDNGLFSYLFDRQSIDTAFEINNPEYSSGLSSTTFHGRDIFAPAAAHLATGVALRKLGPKVDRLVQLPHPVLEVIRQDLIQGEVLHADHFGNLVTSIGMLSGQHSHLRLNPWMKKTGPIEFADTDPVVLLPDGTRIPLTEAFGDVPPDSLTAYIGSAGLLEIAVHGGSASERTGLTRGQPIELRLRG